MARSNGVVEALTPIARRLLTNPEGTSADVLYREGVRYIGNLMSINGNALSAVLTRSLRAAGGRPTNESRRSSINAARGRRVAIWRNPPQIPASV